MKLPLTSHLLQIQMISTLFDFTYTWIFFWTFVIIFMSTKVKIIDLKHFTLMWAD